MGKWTLSQFLLFCLFITIVTFTGGLVRIANAARIDLEDFSSSSIKIDFNNVAFTDPNSGNGAISPILDYQSLGLELYVHNAIGTNPAYDVFRLGGWIPNQDVMIATNVGDNTSIEVVFDFPVSQVGALVAISNARLDVYGGGGNLLEGDQTKNVVYQDNSALRVTEFIGIGNEAGIQSTVFSDISANGRILALDDLIFTPGFEAMVTEDNGYSFDMILGQTISFDYWWEMAQEPDGLNMDIFYFRDNSWHLLGGDINIDGSSSSWQTISFAVPDELQGLETQIRFGVLDLFADTDPTVYLRNIASSGTAPVPEPATILLLGTGLLGLAGFRKMRG